MQINENVLALKSSIGEMMERARKIPGVISLGQGVPAETFPDYVLEDIKRQIIDENEFNKYSPMPGLPSFRQDVAKHLMSKYGAHKIDPEKNILVTCGAAEACAITMATVLEPGDEVILFSPCYPSHIDHIRLSGGKPVFVDLDEENGWGFDMDKLKSAITDRTRVIIVCNPSNPTGGVFSRDELERIVALAREREIFILNDETYNYLLFEPDKFCSLMDVVTEADDLFINCFSFSKEFAMTGFRVGYMYISEKMLEQILKVHITLTICSPTISQKIGSVMLAREDDWAGPYFESFKKKREILMSELDKIPDFISYNPPIGAYYLFAKYRADMPSKELAVKLLEEAHVVTIPGSAFGSAGEGHLRLSFASSENDVREGAKRLCEFLSKFG